MQEIYKDIKGYEGLYQISNLGNIRSLDRQSWNGNSYFTLKGKQLKPANNGHGYLWVYLSKDGKTKYNYIHRLVAEAFIENPENKPCVNHIDFDRQNNCVENLEWVTYTENETHKNNNKQIDHKTNAKRKPVIATNLVTGKELYFDSIREAGRQLNILHQSIQEICKGNTTRRTAGGYTFRYAE